MPVGKYRGQPVAALPTTFLCWFISQDDLRAKHRAVVRAMMAELHVRFRDADAAEAALRPLASPSEP